MKLTLGETARLLGYNNSYFSNRRKQVEDFGPPSMEVSGRTRFDHNEVLNWARENSRKIEPEVLEELLLAYGEAIPSTDPMFGIEFEDEEFYVNYVAKNPEIAGFIDKLDETRHEINRLVAGMQKMLIEIDKGSN